MGISMNSMYIKITSTPTWEEPTPSAVVGEKDE